jgi:hypothetical protein
MSREKSSSSYLHRTSALTYTQQATRISTVQTKFRSFLIEWHPASKINEFDSHSALTTQSRKQETGCSRRKAGYDKLHDQNASWREGIAIRDVGAARNKTRKAKTLIHNRKSQFSDTLAIESNVAM